MEWVSEIGCIFTVDVYIFNSAITDWNTCTAVEKLCIKRVKCCTESVWIVYYYLEIKVYI